MTSRTPPGSPIKGRFRWLRRLFRRIKYRHAKFKDGKHTKGRADVDLWNDDYPISGADYPAHRWRGYSGLRPVLPPEMTSPARQTSPRRHSTPPAPITPSAVPAHGCMASRMPEMIPEVGDDISSPENNSVTTCIPTRKQGKKNTHSPDHNLYGHRRSVDICTQTEAEAAAQAQADAAYLEFLRQEFKNKYRYLTQDNYPTDNINVQPKQVLDLEECLQNPPRPIDSTDVPTQRPRRHTYDISDSVVPAWTPMTREESRAVRFQPDFNEQEEEIVADFQNVHNRIQSEELARRKKRMRKQRKRHRIRNQLYRKIVKPKGYKRLKEAAEDKSEIQKLEDDFEQKSLARVSSSHHYRPERNQITNKVMETSRRVGETTRQIGETTRRASETAKEGFQQVVGGLSRLQLELPSGRGNNYRSFHEVPSCEAPYIQPGIMVN